MKTTKVQLVNEMKKELSKEKEMYDSFKNNNSPQVFTMALQCEARIEILEEMIYFSNKEVR